MESIVTNRSYRIRNDCISATFNYSIGGSLNDGFAIVAAIIMGIPTRNNNRGQACAATENRTANRCYGVGNGDGG